MELGFPPARRRRELQFFHGRHCERSDAIQGDTRFLDCFVALRAPRNDGRSSYRLFVRTWARRPAYAPSAANGLGYMFLASHGWQPFGPQRLVAAKPHNGSAVRAAIAGGTGC
jgi:hypothetical protein